MGEFGHWGRNSGHDAGVVVVVVEEEEEEEEEELRDKARLEVSWLLVQ
jgi:hypothetical protein